MDSLISKETITNIIDQMNEISSIQSQKDFVSLSEKLFDCEQHLFESSDIILTLSSEILNKSGPDKIMALRKIIIISMLTGFLSERYTRDTILDSSSKLDMGIFKREYETVKTYLTRRTNKKGKNLAEIANEE
jgi:hypothetical protein